MSEGMEASLCWCDYEPFDWFEARETKARKRHECCECSEAIEPGEVYETASAIGDGQRFRYKTCLPCTRIRRDYCAPYEGLHEILWETLGTDYINGRYYGEEADE